MNRYVVTEVEGYGIGPQGTEGTGGTSRGVSVSVLDRFQCYKEVARFTGALGSMEAARGAAELQCRRWNAQERADQKAGLA